MTVSTKNLVPKLGTNKKLALQITSALVLSSSVGTVVYAATNDSVTMEVDGKQRIIRTHAKTIRELLQEEHITLADNDEVNPLPSENVKNGMRIIIKKAKLYTIKINDATHIVWSTANTVAELLHAKNIQLNKYDSVMPGLDTHIQGNEVVSIEKAFPVILQDGEQQIQTWSTHATVADFLKKQQIQLRELDRVEPSLDQKITEHTVVKITRVDKAEEIIEQDTPFAVEKRRDTSLSIGTEHLIQEGEMGKVQKTFEVVKENGVEVYRNMIKEVTLKESKDRIIAVGTKQDNEEQTSRSSDSISSAEYYVEATAYSPFCAGCEGVSASGYNLSANPYMKLIAVDPSIIPLGTKVWVEGYGYAVAGDTGGAIKGYRIDVLMPTEEDAAAWGRKRVKIRILKSA